MLRVLIAAGIGGTLPTLCRLAATYSVSDPMPPLPAVGLYVALALFFVIGMAVAFGFGETDLKKAFMLGIAAPAIVTSIVNAASEARENATRPHDAAPSMTRAADPVSRLLGISAAYAQEPATSFPQNQTDSRNTPTQLTISTNLSGTGAGFSSAPVEIRFLSATGVLLESAALSPKLISTLTVPSQARLVQIVIAGKTTSVALPADTIVSAHLTLNIETGRTSDFLWALGSNQRASVKSVSASISDVVRPAQYASANPVKEVPLRAGTTVYSESGTAVGVVESIKRGTGGKPDQILVRGTDTNDDRT